MNNWPHEVKGYSPEDVQHYCVQDQEWQEFRLSLKGLPTESKLIRLDARRHELLAANGNLERNHQVQIDNYINALKRGGQLGMDLRVRK